MRAQGQRDGDGERERARVTEGGERETQTERIGREGEAVIGITQLLFYSSACCLPVQANADGDDGWHAFGQHSYLSDGSGCGGITI